MRRALSLARALLLLACCAPAAAGGPWQSAKATVGSKKFTESVVLGEVLAGHLAQAGIPLEHRRELGGTRVVWSALVAGEIDLYVEYSGTLREELLAGKWDPVAGGGELDGLAEVLAGYGLRCSAPLGFENSYALGMRPERAQQLGLTNIGDLREEPQLELGFGNEFLDRGDGWRALQQRYGLPHERVRGLDHDLAYAALAQGSIDVMDLYTTDPEIEQYGLFVLEDELGHFPSYAALVLYRSDLEQRMPGTEARLERLGGSLDEARMRRLNARVELEGASESLAADEFLDETFGTGLGRGGEGLAARLLRRTREHLWITLVSLAAAVSVGIPLGIFAARRPRLGALITASVGVLQTVPSLALLVLMIPLLGIGTLPAVVACFAYSLLPIVRGTLAGLHGVPQALADSARALGLSRSTRLWRIELPLASRSILAGVQTAAVIDIGLATLGALIGAGGYGQPILTGIRLASVPLLLEGAIPAAGLALCVQGLFGLLERALVPRGLRLVSRGRE